MDLRRFIYAYSKDIDNTQRVELMCLIWSRGNKASVGICKYDRRHHAVDVVTYQNDTKEMCTIKLSLLRCINKTFRYANVKGNNYTNLLLMVFMSLWRNIDTSASNIVTFWIGRINLEA